MEQSQSRPSDPAAALVDGAADLGIVLSPHVAARLVLYMQELLRWNAHVNLTSLETETEILSKHFLDSLAAFKVFEPRPGLRVLDVGSGAGFPGMVLKLQAPMLSVTLLEPSTKRTAFLHHIAGMLGVVNVQIETKRIEDVTEQSGYHLVTSRALRADILLSSAPRILMPGGRVLLYRTVPLHTPPEGYNITRQVSLSLPFTSEHRTLTLLKLKHDIEPSSVPLIESS